MHVCNTKYFKNIIFVSLIALVGKDFLTPNPKGWFVKQTIIVCQNAPTLQGLKYLQLLWIKVL